MCKRDEATDSLIHQTGVCPSQAPVWFFLTPLHVEYEQNKGDVMTTRRSFLQLLGLAAISAPVAKIASENFADRPVPVGSLQTIKIKNASLSGAHNGHFQFATQAEADSGISHTQYMTPLRVQQSLNKALNSGDFVGHFVRTR